jgi:hypothetical protein
MTYAVISIDDNPTYSFFAPIAAWCWRKLNIETICIVVSELNSENGCPASAAFVWRYLEAQKHHAEYLFVKSADRKATYAQVSRLFAAARYWLKEDDILITSDVDMATFSTDFHQVNPKGFLVFGYDLTPTDQTPMCYVTAPVWKWRAAFRITSQFISDRLGEELDHEQMENMRGCIWSRDQELMHRTVSEDPELVKIPRARPGTQFATHRVDRDDVNWRAYPIPGRLIDAHLWRPGYTEENFSKILELFMTMYPEENFEWMVEYKNEFIKLI